MQIATYAITNGSILSPLNDREGHRWAGVVGENRATRGIDMVGDRIDARSLAVGDLLLIGVGHQTRRLVITNIQTEYLEAQVYADDEGHAAMEAADRVRKEWLASVLPDFAERGAAGGR